MDAYVKGETKDFKTVGVKALDDHTIQYTLVRPESFWNSKTTSGVLFPVNADFLKSQGKEFWFFETLSSILYNGPYYLKSLTSKSEIELVKNKDYYDAKNVHIDNVKLTFNDGSNPDSIIKNFEKGQYSFASVMPNSSTYKSVKKNFGDNIVYGLQLGTSYYLGFNLDRQKYDHTAKTTDEQKASTKKAILNKDFRQAVNFGLTANHMRHKYLDLMRLKIPFVALWCHQLMSKSMEKILVKSLKNNWLPMGINGRV